MEIHGPLTEGRLTPWRCEYLNAVAAEYDEFPEHWSPKTKARSALWRAFGSFYLEGLYESPEEEAVYAAVRRTAYNLAATRSKWKPAEKAAEAS